MFINPQSFQQALQAQKDAEKYVKNLQLSMPSAETLQTLSDQLLHAEKEAEKIKRNIEHALPSESTLRAAYDTIRYAQEQIKVINNNVCIQSALRDIQQIWLGTIVRVVEDQPAQEDIKKAKLIQSINGEVKFDLTVNKPRKKNSQHMLLLEALLYKTDDKGFIAYEDLEKYFVEKGLKSIADRKKSQKRIWDTCSALFRFFPIPKKYKWSNFIKKIKGKGLQMYNPMM